jgi:LEA14-like dessication related protein
MGIRGALFGSKLRIAVVAVLALAVTVAGAYAVGILGVPSVENVENRFGDVDNSTTEIETDLTVYNPNPIGIRLGGVGVNYTVAMNGIEMATGEKNGVGIGTGNSTVSLTTLLQNDRIPEWWASHVNGGERTALTVDATVSSSTLGQSAGFSPVNRSIETDILGQFNSTEDQPVNANVPLVDDPILVIEERRASWGEATTETTPIDMEFRVFNPKQQPVVVSNIGYNITMNGIDVGSGETEEAVSIPPEAAEEVGLPTAMRTQALDEWWVSHLQNNQVTQLTIDFYVEVSPPGSGETIRVPLDDATYTKTIETDFFGSKAGGSGAGAGGESSGSGDETTSDGDSEDTTTQRGDETTQSDDDSTTTQGGDDTTTTTQGDDTTTTTTQGDGDSTTTSDGSGDGTTTTDDGLLGRERVTG